MEITNKKERNNAFLQFIGIFLGSIIIVNVGLFFDYKIPTNQVKVLKAEKRQLEQNKGNTSEVEEFYTKIETILNSEEGHISDKNIDEVKGILTTAKKKFPENVFVSKVNLICHRLIALNESLAESKEQSKEFKDKWKKVKADFDEYKEDME